MSDRDLKIRLIFEGQDKLSKKIGNLFDASKRLKGQMAETRDIQRGLEAAMARSQAFEKQAGRVKEYQDKLAAANEKLAARKEALAAVDKPNQKMIQGLLAAERLTAKASASLSREEAALAQVAGEMQRAGMATEKLKAELTEKMKMVPGYVPALLQPIENRILMLYTGIRAQLGVKIYGDNLDAIQRKAFEVEKLIKGVAGATGVSPSRVQGKPYLNIAVDRQAMARYGLNAKDVLDVVEIAIGGKNVSTTIEGRQRFPIQIRVDRSERDDIDKLGAILIAAKPGMSGGEGTNNQYIPLGMVAKITREIGANEIASENGRLRSYVQANVQDRDLGGFVQEVEQKLKSLNWQGMTYKLTGEYENQRRFVQTMLVVFPIVLLVIFVLLYIVYHSALEAAHVMLAVPFALSGGVLLQKLLGYNFNGAVWVGYIALFGTAVQTGVVMVVYLEETVKARMAEMGAAFSSADLMQAVKDGARLRLRPKVMTVATIVASLLPIMWSHRQGAEVMQPLATPVIGGMLSSLLHILIVTPVIFYWLRQRELQKKR